MEEILFWYKKFSSNAGDVLGKNDWIQLWKSISWSKKEKLKGKIRLAVDYLQWAVMLRRVLGEANKQYVPDIDEISNLAHDDILKIDNNQYSFMYGGSYRKSWNIDIDREDQKQLSTIIKMLSDNESKDKIEKSFNKYAELGLYIDWNKNRYRLTKIKPTTSGKIDINASTI